MRFQLLYGPLQAHSLDGPVLLSLVGRLYDESDRLLFRISCIHFYRLSVRAPGVMAVCELEKQDVSVTRWTH